MKNLVSLGVFLLILLSVQVNAQEQSVLQIRPTGRILMDGGLFHSDNKNFVDGVAIPDARIGVKATYGKYKAKVDIGYAYGKVSLKDIFVERQFSSHALLRVGNFVHQFGLQSSTTWSIVLYMIQGDCFSWVFPVLTKHLDTIANLHLTILALTWGLISRRVLQKSEL